MIANHRKTRNSHLIDTRNPNQSYGICIYINIKISVNPETNGCTPYTTPSPPHYTSPNLTTHPAPPPPPPPPPYLWLGEVVQVPGAQSAIGRGRDEVVGILRAHNIQAVDWVGVAEEERGDRWTGVLFPLRMSHNTS